MRTLFLVLPSFLVCCFCLFFSTPAFAQLNTEGDPRIDVLPQFPGGDEALMAYVAENTNPVQGTVLSVRDDVIVRFIVKEDGTIEYNSIVKGIGPEYDAEAERLVKNFPKWTPAKIDNIEMGTTVTIGTVVVLPIRFASTNPDSLPVRTIQGPVVVGVEAGDMSGLTNRKAVFPLGERGLFMYLFNNIQSPIKGMDGESRSVSVEFMIEEDGNIINEKIIEDSVEEAIEAEALRLVRAMPRWWPALYDGLPVATRTRLPITFSSGKEFSKNESTNEEVEIISKTNLDAEFIRIFQEIEEERRYREQLRPHTRDTTLKEGSFLEPAFVGGYTALDAYLRENTMYPMLALTNNVMGTVVVKVLIDADGKPIKTKVVETLDPDCDAEAVRLIMAMPNWLPAESNKKPTKYWVKVEVPFVLSQE